MRILKSPVLYLSAALLLLVMAFKNKPADAANEVGDIRYSILSPDLFSKNHPGKWMLLDGKPLEEDTDLYKLLDENNVKNILTVKDGIPDCLPDARGVFLRGMNMGRETSTGDTDGDRKIGSYQSDTLKSHHHTYLKPRRGGNGSDTDDDEVYIWDVTNTSDFGGAETRPRNVTMYIYIKVSG
jgi:hypothetical protein